MAELGSGRGGCLGSRFRLLGQIIGGGAKGIVQTALDEASGRTVAVKQVQCDKACPIRFLQFKSGDGSKDFSAEGYAPEFACSSRIRSTWEGPLAFSAGTNEFGAKPFETGSLMGCSVLLRRGGGVSFAEKARNAKLGGAVGVIFINEADDAEVYSFGNDLQALPSVMITRSDGDKAVAMLQGHYGNAADAISSTWAKVQTDVGHEVLVSSRLPCHRNVVEVLEAWEEGDAAVIVMSLCRGGPAVTQAAALRRQYGSERWLAKTLLLVREMFLGLAELHMHGICHRDLKPENLLLATPICSDESHLVVADLSMASTAGRLWVPCGSLRYSAPEVFAGSYDLKRDVWSAGIITFELLCGYHPFGSMRDDELLQLLRGPSFCLLEALGLKACPPQDVCGQPLDAAVLDLLRVALQPDPEKRIASFQVLEHPALRPEALLA